jgi:hypothetical protein
LFNINTCSEEELLMIDEDMTAIGIWYLILQKYASSPVGGQTWSSILRLLTHKSFSDQGQSVVMRSLS